MILTIEKALKLINKEIGSYNYGQEPKELYEPISYLMGLGGKRMRPLLAVLSHHLFSDEVEKVLKPAMAIEVFHNFTLMHDDIMDKAPLRRGNATVHEKWNENIAILSGDVMLVRAYDLMLTVDSNILKRSLELFNKVAAEVCEGQQLDMNFETREKVSIEEYISMIRLKTAVLLGFSLELGGLVGGASEKNQALLKEFGDNLGIGFQLMDDLLDVYGDMSKFGKATGGDIIANKKTYLLINALQKAKGADAKKLQSLIESKSIDSITKIKEVTAIYNKLEIKSLTELKISEYFDIAFKKLDQIDATLYKKNIMKDFLKQLAQREN